MENTTVTATSRWERFPPGRGAGVQLHGVGNTIANNIFDSIPHQSIRVYGNDHLIEANTFRNSLFETSDSGVIYSGRDWTILGNVVRGNTITGVHSLYYPRLPWMYKVYPLPDGRWGDYVKCIHLDDQVGGFLIEGNSFTNYSFGFDINGGGRHTLRNNTFGQCPETQCTLVVSQHAVGGKRPWTKANKLPCEPINPSVLSNLMGLGAVPWNSVLWRTRYPRFAAMMDERTYCVPYGNAVVGNTYRGVPCVDYPVTENTGAELRLWGFQQGNNTNTLHCN